MENEISSNSSVVIEELYKMFYEKHDLEFVLSFHANTSNIPPKGEATIDDFIRVAKDVNEPDSIFIHFNNDDNDKKEEMMMDQDFKDLIEKHNYFQVYKDSWAEKGRIYLEPKYPKNMTSWVKEECGNIVYHITADTNVEEILTKGIDLCDKQKKHNNKLYQRYYNKNKAFFVAIKNNENIEDVLNAVSEEFFSYYKENPVFMKIDLNKCNDAIQLYKDTAMNNTNNENTYSVYSLEKIPAECASTLDIVPKKLEVHEK